MPLATSLTIILGIDPGLSGALAFYDLATKKCDVFDMPRAAGNSTLVDAYALGTIIDRFAKRTLLAVVEDVGAHKISGRKQGAVSMFNFGVSKGMILGALGGYQIPVRMAALSWKTAMGLSSDKTLSRERAAALIPSLAPKLTRKKDDGRAEAALLALFGAAGISKLGGKK